MAQSWLNQSVVRGLRNNNPGNLVRTSSAWQGKIPFANSNDTKFEQFYEIAWGIRAFFKNLNTQITGGKNTLTKFITVYAPQADNNDTETYISTVASILGTTATGVMPVSKAFFVALAKAMFRVELGETGYNQLTQANFDDAWFYYENNYQYGDSDLPNLEISSDQRCKYCGHILALLGLFFFIYSTNFI